jgi:Eco57I restriction-modification methylase
MPLNVNRVRQLLKEFDFSALFREELGWDTHNAPLEIQLDGQPQKLQAVAQKRGMVALRCPTPAGGHLPEYSVRRKIEQQVAKAAHEHLIIFTDAAKTTQIWQWVKREPGKPAACREHTFHKSQTGDALIQKLEVIAFTLAEEETLVLGDVTRRARAGFDVERVTKRFYEIFQKEHTAFLKFITGITESTDHEWYASVMLNRLMFVYFIQRKGFLDGDRDYLRNRLNRCQKEKGRDNFYSFYRYFLLRLFHEGFGKRPKERAADLEKLIGRIPYLNGGMFERHDIEKRYGDDIQIPDKAFERIFDYFDQYQWHLDERPLRADNEINPDVLGYIFEKYINQKQMGAYYTKEDITEYIGKNTVLPFLFDAARPKCKIAFENPNGPTIWDLLRENPDRYIYDAVKMGAEIPLPKEIAAGIKDVSKRDGWNKSASAEFALPTEIWREVVARRQRYDGIKSKIVNHEVENINDLVTLNLDIRQFAQDVIENCEGPELLRAFWHAIEKLTALDLTCGSGAFLFAALNILEPLYEACLDRMEAFVAEHDRSGEKHRPEKFSDFRNVLERVAAHPSRRYFIFKSIILNNLFGVDIMEEAVEICKLRLFLKLAAQVEPDAGKENFGIEPLPDIDFNIRVGNTLVGYATADEVKRCMKELGGGQMKLLSGDDLASYERFLDRLQIADAAWRSFRRQQTELGGAVTVADKADLKAKLKTLEDELNRYLAGDYGVKVSDKAAYAKWVKTHQPFHWFVEFYGIVSGGGFDVIIGNPPYVEYKEVRKDYQIKGYTTEECGNLYAFTWERSIALANRAGRIGLIIPVASVCTDGYAALRKVWIANGNLVVSNFNDRPGKLFDGLEHIRLAIVLLFKSNDTIRSIHTTAYSKWFTEARGHLFQSLHFTQTTKLVRDGSMPKVGSEVEASVLVKVSSSSKTLHHFVSATGRNRIFYTRKLSWFVQILDFVPSITDERGRKREPSELKEVVVSSEQHRNSFLCALNSTLFYWLLTVWSDCRNLNKREVFGIPLDFDALDTEARTKLDKLAVKLMDDLRKNSKTLNMNYEDWGAMKIQCIYPKFSKPILDEIDRVLARHYGFTAEELDFILNYDIKYRLGRDTESDVE